MFTIDYESVNGGIYRNRGQAATITAAQRIAREGLRGLDCYHLVFIADAATGRQVCYGERGRRGGWTFYPVTPLSREDLHHRLTGFYDHEDASDVLDRVDTLGEYQFTRTDDYGPLHWRARRYGDGTYALDKIPA